MKYLLQSAGIVFSLGYLGLSSVWEDMPVQVEWGFCAVLLATLGIPHGAADHLVAEKLAHAQQQSFQLPMFLVKYLSVMAAYLLLWYISPLVSFGVFIAISVFHFGDLETTAVESRAQVGLPYYLQILRSFVLGVGILGFILSQHAQEVTPILQKFDLGITLDVETLPAGFYVVCMLLGFQKEHTVYFIYTGITLWIGIYLPLLPAFMCYFAGCHSMYSLRVLATSLQCSLWKLVGQLVPFTLAAISLGTIYLYLVSPQKWVAHAFIFLSILTLPHFFLMHKIIPKRP
ncbi:Brp/Blh family beta-carotene 15,15'-dioxygenase [Aquirufa sp.]|jgi:Brp/Blh family beta-carotene 15,15'-monooxygenase|uniref:Brp/Blh family beta-carotene 15,15'-dioxygenase n=1 Tax=Aquirufa sp. TaxID=2676249 RepID=UPI0037C05D72